MIIKDVTLNWAKLNPANPDTGFDGTAQDLSVEIATTDKEVAATWKTAGMNVKPKEFEGKISYTVKVKKPLVNRKGVAQKPVTVVGRDLMPIEDVDSVGNGSVGNVKLFTFDYDYAGRKGVGFRLQAVQVTDLKEFKGSGAELEGFESLDGDSFSAVEDDIF